MDLSPDHVASFRQTSPYIKAYRGKTFVLMLPGAAVTHENFANIIHDIALLNHLGVRIVLVHGARQQVEQQLGDKGATSQIVNGKRVTTPDILEQYIQAVGSTRFKIEAAMSTGLPNSPMYKANIQVRGGNFVSAMPCGVIDGVDLQYTGKIRKVDTVGLDELLYGGAIALVSPIAYSATGEIFNLSYTEIATEIAIELQADKIIAFTKNNGVLDDDGELLRQITLLQCEKLLLRKELSDSHYSLKACHKACDQGVNRAQIISYAEDGALVEIEHFTVMEIDGTIVSCAALYPFVQANAGELACVATHDEYQKGGRAAKLLAHIEKQASKIKMSQLFVLTTQTEHWFLEQGFKPSSLEILPKERKRLYNYQRSSKIFVKALK